jgi:hypothetical protein
MGERAAAPTENALVVVLEALAADAQRRPELPVRLCKLVALLEPVAQPLVHARELQLRRLRAHAHRRRAALGRASHLRGALVNHARQLQALVGYLHVVRGVVLVHGEVLLRGGARGSGRGGGRAAAAAAAALLLLLLLLLVLVLLAAAATAAAAAPAARGRGRGAAAALGLALTLAAVRAARGAAQHVRGGDGALEQHVAVVVVQGRKHRC